MCYEAGPDTLKKPNNGRRMLQIEPELVPTLVMMVPFLVALLALHFILFRPLFDYMEEREQVGGKATEEAERFAAATTEKLEKLEQLLIEARLEAGEIRSAARGKAQEEETAIIAAARAAADAELDKALAEISEASKTASNTLKTTGQSLSNEIAQQVLGRPVAQS